MWRVTKTERKVVEGRPTKKEPAGNVALLHADGEHSKIALGGD